MVVNIVCYKKREVEETIMIDKDLHQQTEGRQSYMDECEVRRKNVENAMAIMLSATNGPDTLFKEVLNDYILGEITIEELEKRIDRFEYLET